MINVAYTNKEKRDVSEKKKVTWNMIKINHGC
jgi:hypothetical protein